MPLLRVPSLGSRLATRTPFFYGNVILLAAGLGLIVAAPGHHRLLSFRLHPHAAGVCKSF